MPLLSVTEFEIGQATEPNLWKSWNGRDDGTASHDNATTHTLSLLLADRRLAMGLQHVIPSSHHSYFFFFVLFIPRAVFRLRSPPCPRLLLLYIGLAGLSRPAMDSREAN